MNNTVTSSEISEADKSKVFELSPNSFYNKLALSETCGIGEEMIGMLIDRFGLQPLVSEKEHFYLGSNIIEALFNHATNTIHDTPAKIPTQKALRKTPKNRRV